MSSDISRVSRKSDLRAMLFVGALFSRENPYKEAVERLVSIYGPVLAETPALSWGYSGVYDDELGTPVMRRFVFFERLVSQDGIADVKIETCRLESELSVAGRRQVNLDPGYLTEAKVVLVTRKDYSHRICLGKGVFAESTLYFMDGSFRPSAFTYKDYREYGALKMFGDMRVKLRRLLRQGRGA